MLLSPMKFEITARPKDNDKFTDHLYSKYANLRFYQMISTTNYAHGIKDEVFYFLENKKIYLPYGLAKSPHEISHMVDMNDFSRLVKPDWGMKMGHNERGPNFFYACLAREVRVRAIQHVMTEYASEKEKKDNTLQNIFKNQCWVPPKSFLNFGRFKKFSDVEEWAFDIRDKTIARWSKDRVESEWHKRLEFIQNYIEEDKPLVKITHVESHKELFDNN